MSDEETVTFTLPHGYTDSSGKSHREGVMRVATAHDELAPQRDPRVQGNPGYLPVLVLARVLVRLGELTEDAVTPEVIEKLRAEDFAFLRGLYRRVNQVPEEIAAKVRCPQCGAEFVPNDASPVS